MATLNDLRTSIQALLALPNLGAALQLNRSACESAFEVYTLSCLAQAVRQAGGTSTLCGRNSGPNPPIAVFRGGHGTLGSIAHDYAYVLCNLGDKEFELHTDIQYAGSSDAIHEIDVSVYDHDAATIVRDTPNTFASTRKLYGAIECKFYDSPLGTVLGRTFVGLTTDCGTLKFKAFATNGYHTGLARYFGHGEGRGDPFFGLSPLRPDVERRFISFFEQAFRRWAKIV